MARVIWAPDALSKIELIRLYISQFNPLASERLTRRLVQAALSLEDFPNRGRPAGAMHRELTIVPPYVIRYKVERDRVTITDVKHGRQRSD